MHLWKTLLVYVTMVLVWSASSFGSFQAGAGSVDISPVVGDDALRGMNGELQLVEKAHDPLFVKAVVFEFGSEQIALVSYDMILFDNDWFEALRRRLSEELEVDHLICTLTHTHGSGIPTTDFVERLLDAGVEATRKAQASLAPAEVGVGTGQVEESYNRRLLQTDGTVKMLWNNSQRAPSGPIDNEVGVISIRGREDRKQLAVLVNYTAHPVISMNFRELIVSGDYPGALEAKLEERLGGDALFLLGAVGDINAYDAGLFETANDEEVFEAVERMAETLATEVEQVHSAIESYSQPEIGFDLVKVPLAERAAGKAAPPSVEVDIATLAFGDAAALVFLPGEPFVELGIDLKNRSPLENTFVVSQTNGHHWYLPTMKAIREGGYGADSATYLEVGAGERLVNEALVLLYYQLDLVRPLQSR